MGLFGQLGLGPSGAGVAAAAPTGQSGPTVVDALNAEARLLHRRLDLSGVMCWDRREKSWKPLSKLSEKLLVLNLWSASCKPCLAEFPLFRRMAAAWQRERGVRFLFIGDPPHDTEAPEVIAFWQQHAAEVPEADPCRSTTDKLRAALDNNSQPLTLLVDEQGVVRQALVGAIQERGLASAMERLLKVLRASPKSAP
jgi:thiol-disulfide isomerase/thioredoxin